MEGVASSPKTTRKSLRRPSRARSSRSRDLQASKITSRQNRKTTKAMDGLIDRVTSGRIFKQIVEYACGRKGATSKLLLSSSVVEDPRGTYHLGLIQQKYHDLHAPQIQSADQRNQKPLPNLNTPHPEQMQRITSTSPNPYRISRR